MAKYLVLIYGSEQEWASMSAQESQRIDDGHRAFNAAAGPAVLFGTALEDTATATSLRQGTNGAPLLTDGPFLETKEVVGGFYLMEAADLDAALALAALLPEVAAAHSGVEVRPLRGNS